MSISFVVVIKKSLVRALILDVRLCRLPPLVGWARVKATEDSKCCQALDVVGSCSMRPMMVVSKPLRRYNYTYVIIALKTVQRNSVC